MVLQFINYEWHYQCILFFYSVPVLRHAMLTSEMRCVINRNHFSICWSKFWRIYFWFYNLRLFNRQIGYIDTCNVLACIICNLHLLIWATPASQPPYQSQFYKCAWDTSFHRIKYIITVTVILYCNYIL